MGKRLFTIGSPGPGMALLIPAALFAAGSAPFLLDTQSRGFFGDWSSNTVLGVVLLSAAALFALAGWTLLWRRTQFYERGVVAFVGAKIMRMRFADLKWFSLTETDVPGKRVRHAAIRFCTRDGIVFGAIVPSAAGATDERILRAKALACEAIAARMEAELRLKQRVPWIFHKDNRIATELTPEGVLVKTSQGLIPYQSLEVKLADGEFALLYNGHELFAGHAGAANFYPGLTLIEKRKAASAQPSAVR